MKCGQKSFDSGCETVEAVPAFDNCFPSFLFPAFVRARCLEIPTEEKRKKDLEDIQQTSKQEGPGHQIGPREYSSRYGSRF